MMPMPMQEATKQLSDRSIMKDEEEDEEGRSYTKSASDPSQQAEEDSRDEMEEVRNAAKHETWNVRVWRLLVTGALFITAVCVTATTYSFLQRKQQDNFKTAFKQFSRTVGDAAIGQQKDLRVAFRSLADNLSAFAISTNQTWPRFRMPMFESYAGYYRELSHTETFAVYRMVLKDELDEYIDFVNRTYEEVVAESHVIERGNTEMLRPVGYHPYPSSPTPNGFVPDKERDAYFPSWHFSPAPLTYGFINWNPLSVGDFGAVVKAVIELKNETLFSPVRKYVGIGVALSAEDHEAMHSELRDSTAEHPHSIGFLPIHKYPGDYESPLVGIISCGMAWDRSLQQLLPENVDGVVIVISNTCNQAYTYEIDGGDAIFMGNGDLHDAKYHDYRVDLALNDNPKSASTPGHCQFSMHVYPSKTFEQAYNGWTPVIFAIVVGVTFVGVTAVFFIYDMFVQRRNEKLVENAAQSNAIVSSLFPTSIRDRIIAKNGKSKNAQKRIASLKNFLSGEISSDEAQHNFDGPLADLFLETTVMFADIAGFTAWSSVREPSQVFTFLETIFSSFDQIAKARRVFKVETVGDCYVAATGIPEQRKDHAVIMVRFARDILTRMYKLTKDLEITHGPDTGDLSLRVGLHSGPVTAGVLRGDRCRFQLFGDTMNTASRIEHTGEVGRIHVSTETAEALQKCGKGKWIIRRHGTVEAKGKGDIQTYWIVNTFEKGMDPSSSGDGSETDPQDCILPNSQLSLGVHSSRSPGTTQGERHSRLINWNVEMLLIIIRQIVARRNAMAMVDARAGSNASSLISKQMTFHRQNSGAGGSQHHSTTTASLEDYMSASSHLYQPLDEVQEIIHLPEFSTKAIRKQEDPGDVVISSIVIEQLRDLVTSIACMYRNNAFHNFEHASHVTMSVIKLLARIIAPSDLEMVDGYTSLLDVGMAETLHDHTYGITSDPLTQFACAFSALIHDIDHTGVPNSQLVKEKTRIASMYKNRSIAEQNSLALAWELFMTEEYDDLRRCICPSPDELYRLRQLVVNSVMATDIVDKDLKNLRNARWEKAFAGDVHGKAQSEDSDKNAIDRKATIVIEHLIQASDVAHTMQHWHVYRKWNERFFRECYRAYLDGRSDTNPVDTWYEGEIGFFDFYIIPLAKKLKDCGVFGKSSDEYLTYAQNNRKEWERRGREVVAEMVAKINSESDSAVSVIRRRPSATTADTDDLSSGGK